MAALEFKFSSDQQHQLEAIEATCDLFRGQQFIGSVFSADSGRKGQTAIGELMVGHGNELRVAPGQLLDNLHAVQEEGCLPATDVLTDGRLRDFTVEMETGTGKTYVYIRSIYELNRRYGITKFVIVVPSVAIREGVLKSLQTTRRHFETLYDRTPLDYFVYDSKDMGPVGNFATSSSIQVMVINIDAFNKGLEKDGTAKEGNLFHRPSEKLTGGFSPRELVSACKPVVIIDEPQSVDNTKQAKAAIKSLNPLFVLRYSATHKQAYNMIYRLTPVDAFERHLVKGICVDSIKAEANLNGAYVRLESVKSDPFSAKVSIDVRQADGTQKRKAVTVKTGNDLYQKSGENSDYESGWVVNNIGAAVGDEFIEFQNGEVLELGEALGDVNEEVVKRAQIRRTIRTALEAQGVDFPCEIDVLVTSDDGIHEINRTMRDVDRPTDVLSFPEFTLTPGELPSPEDADPGTGLVPLGDMVLSLERVRAQAKEYGHSNRREMSYLVTHSVLHLLGYDHLDEGPMKRQMREREEAIMSLLGLER